MQTIRHQRAPHRAGRRASLRITQRSASPTPAATCAPTRAGTSSASSSRSPTSFDLDELPAGFRSRDVAEPRETIAEARRRLVPCFPALAGLEIAEYHQGITSFAPDGRYLIGPVPGVEGLIVASGCAAVGIAGSAAVAAGSPSGQPAASPARSWRSSGCSGSGSRPGTAAGCATAAGSSTPATTAFSPWRAVSVPVSEEIDLTIFGPRGARLARRMSESYQWMRRGSAAGRDGSATLWPRICAEKHRPYRIQSWIRYPSLVNRCTASHTFRQAPQLVPPDAQSSSFPGSTR